MVAGILTLAVTQTIPDLVIRNAWIIDGTGNPAFKADLAITGKTITQIGDLPPAKNEIDAQGKVITPGFIDVHTHAENVTSIPNAENFIRMGVTTIVIGNCGGSEDDLGAFFNKIERDPVSVNVASLVGHNTIRRKAMGGSFDRQPTPDELAKMKEHVRQAMQDGAVGLSTGLIYLPGTYSKTEEIIELAKVSDEFKGIYATHMRSEGTEIMSAIDEMIRIGQESGSRVQYSHIKLSGPNMWGKSNDVFARLTQARQNGLELTQDQYAYTASSTSISTLIPDSALEGGTEAFKKRMADPKTKQETVDFMKRRLKTRTQTDYAYAVIASCRAKPELNGKNIVEAAKILRGADTLDDQIETILWIQSTGGASGVFHGMSENDIKSFMSHPNTMVASDASCRAFGEDVPHPRGYGNNARVLQKYVNAQGHLLLEDAVRKMTSLPAQTFRFTDRGLLKPGYAADLVIFDPTKITENTTYTDPHAYATGFDYVFVNGQLTVKSDKHLGTRSGIPLRRSGYTPRLNITNYEAKNIVVSACCATH
jgi:N-acyl-D-amino-acid deacylase